LDVGLLTWNVIRTWLSHPPRVECGGLAAAFTD
jgi:hypothetical protein